MFAAVAVQGPDARKPALGGSVPGQSREAGGIGVFQLPAGAAVGGSAGSGREILLTAARTAAKAAQLLEADGRCADVGQCRAELLAGVDS